jgi:long-chain acyl-CoA synthetase
LRRVIATNIKQFLPQILRLLFTLFKEKQVGHRIRLQSGDLWLIDVLRRPESRGHRHVTIGPNDPALLLFTGGTTGTPKAVLGTHQALLMSAMQTDAWFKPVLTDWDDTVLLAMPLFHVYGNIGILATSLVGHNTLAVVPNPRDLDDLLGTVQKARPTFVPGVPTLFNALLNHPKVQSGQVDFTPIALCISGAAPLLAETKARFEKLTGGRVVEAYSITEAINAAVISPVQGRGKPGAVGLPLPDVDIRIVDLETGRRDLSAGEIGEILLCAPQLMRGYWERPSETADMIREGWLFTRDIGYLDEDGYLYIVDRKKDMIKPSGFAVWPREVEEVIASHPAVAEVGVAGVPDSYQGGSVKAWIVQRVGNEVTADQLRAYCRERLAAYKVLKHFEFHESLPKTQVGKIARRELVVQHTVRSR